MQAVLLEPELDELTGGVGGQPLPPVVRVQPV